LTPICGPCAVTERSGKCMIRRKSAIALGALVIRPVKVVSMMLLP
jgi:hypothetical protein